jgi:outer membrane murein-binding lipoprotein Lpp
VDCFTKIGTPVIALPALLLISITVAGCRKDAEVNATVSAVDALTTELGRRIEAAANPSDGVDDAQQYLDSRKTEIAGKMGSLKSLRDDQVSDETKRKLASRLAEDAAKVGDLQVKYVSHSISNPAFKAKLDKLVSDYQTLLTR